jgi:hypothetical protein
MPDKNYYKVGGSLEYQHPTYVVRQADFDLYDGLTNENQNIVEVIIVIHKRRIAEELDLKNFL